MAKSNWAATLDIRTADYVVPTNVEVLELRANSATGGQVGLRGGNGEAVVLGVAPYDVFRAPAIPTRVKRVVRMETTVGLRYNMIELVGWQN